MGFRQRSLAGLACAGLVLGLAASAGAAVQYTITDLGALGGVSSPEKINELGQVAGYGDAGAGVRGFYWDGGSRTWIDTFGGTRSQAAGVNNSGQVVGWGYTGSSSSSARAFLWQNGVLQNLNTAGGPTLTKARDINDAGQVVVTGTAGGYIWQNGVLTALPLEDPLSINSLSQVAGGKQTGQVDWNGAPVERAVLWDHGVLTDLGTFGGPGSLAMDMNEYGEVVGWAETGDQAPSGYHVRRAFLYQNGAIQQIPLATPDQSTALGVNNLGQVVGQYGGPSFPDTSHAFLFDAGVVVDLNDLIPANSGWVLRSATDINDHGQIVGVGGFGSDTFRLFLLTPVPEPATIFLLAGCAFAWLRRRT